jgi:hypothetical protein
MYLYDLRLAHAGLGAQIEHGSGWKFSVSDEPVANYEPLGVEVNKSSSLGSLATTNIPNCWETPRLNHYFLVLAVQ